MPTVLRVGPYRFFFYSNEGHEPPHIHISSGDGEAKVWLDPVEVAWSAGLNERQMKRVLAIIEENREMMLAAWQEYFGEGADGSQG